MEENKTEYEEDLKKIRKKLHDGSLSVMIGAGFSKNANHKFPNWNQLMENIVLELYSEEIMRNYILLNGKNIRSFKRLPKSYIDKEIKLIITRETPLGIVSQYIKKHGYKEVITTYIEKQMLSYDEDPNNFFDLHKSLLDLPWNNVYTTNYDTLLEVADKKRDGSKYKVVKKAEDLSIGVKRRIIKLHGCFKEEYFDGDIRTRYIISKEDYEEYPTKHEAFTQLMRISLLQESFCLIGFSGDDPNFLSWVEWIRDILSKKAKDNEKEYKIYILDVKENDESSSGKKLYFKNLSIKFIPIRENKLVKFLEEEVNIIRSKIGDFEDLYDNEYKRIFQLLFIYLNNNPKDIKTELENLQTSDEIKKYEVTLQSLSSSFDFTNGTDINKVLNLYEEIKTINISIKFPTPLMISYSFNWIASLLKYIKKEIDINIKAKLFGLISLGLKLNLMSINYYYFEERLTELFKEFNSIDFSNLDNDSKIDYKSFVHIVLRDSVLFNSKENFEEWSNKLQSFDYDENDKNIVSYYNLMLHAINFRYDKLQEELEVWKPEENKQTAINWIIKKSGLLCVLKNKESTYKAYQLLIDNEYRLKDEKHQEQLYFYEMLSHLDFSVNISSRFKGSSEYNKKEKSLKNIGIRSIRDSYEFLVNRHKREENIKPIGEDRYTYTTNSISVNSSDEFSNSFRIINLFFESAIPLKISENTVYINKSEGLFIFENTYKEAPDINLFYSYQFSGNNASEDFFRMIAQKFVQDNNSIDFMPFAFDRMVFLFKYLLEKNRLDRASLFFISQILDAIPYIKWSSFFEYFWNKFNTDENLRKFIYFKDNIRTLEIFVENCIKFLEDKTTLKNILHDILIIKDDNEQSKIEYLYYWITNPFVRKELKFFKKETKNLIDILINNLSHNFDLNLIVLNNISELIDNNQEILIINQIKTYLKSIENYNIPDNLVKVLFHFSKKDIELQNTIKILLFGSRFWKTGFIITKDNSYVSLQESPILLKILRKQGLILNDDEIKLIYKQLKVSIQDIIILESKFKEQLGEFDVINEMLQFLKDEKALLSNDNEYQFIYEKVLGIYKRFIKNEKIYLSLSSQNPDKVIIAISNLSNNLFIDDMEDFDINLIFILNKVILKNEPKLEASIEFVADILKKLKQKRIFYKYQRYYEVILENYLDNLPENNDKVFIEQQVIKIAITLKKWKIKNTFIDNWIDIKNRSRFSSIRNMNIENN